MSLEQNKILVRRLVDEDLNTGNLEAANEIVVVDYVDHTNPPGLQYGLESHKQIVTIFHAAFPDVTWTIEDMIAAGDKVAVRLSMRGTHEGEFFGILPTGKQVLVTGIHILRIANGKIAEHWGNNDDLGLMQQLGALPAMAQAEGDPETGEAAR
jgi:predicted ester cyclase